MNDKTLAEVLGVEENEFFTIPNDGNEYFVGYNDLVVLDEEYERYAESLEVIEVYKNRDKTVMKSKWSQETIEQAKKDLSCERFEYVAKDKGNALCIYSSKPYLSYGNFYGSDEFQIKDSEYPEVKPCEYYKLKDIISE